jgi:hypothetical protein
MFRQKIALSIVATVAMALLAGGCAEPETQKITAVPAFFVPSTGMTQVATADAVSPQINPYAVLPTSDAYDYFIGREEKGYYGALTVSETAAYSNYTYDAQRISGPWSLGYRYRSVVQTGVTFP